MKLGYFDLIIFLVLSVTGLAVHYALSSLGMIP